MYQPIRVVVAEDLDVLREHFCSLIMQEADMALAGQANSGKSVLQLLERSETLPHVILMDIEMDVKHDGIITAQAILGRYPQIKIVFLTMHEDDETIFSAFETGAVDYVLKTNGAQVIINGIRSAYQGISQIRPEIAFKIKNEFARIRKTEEGLYKASVILSQLTPTEVEILDLMLKEMKVHEMARHRQVEVSTIKSQINMLLKKFKKKRSKEVVALLRELNATPLLNKVKQGETLE